MLGLRFKVRQKAAAGGFLAELLEAVSFEEGAVAVVADHGATAHWAPAS